MDTTPNDPTEPNDEEVPALGKVPTAEQLDVWIGQLSAAQRRDRLRTFLVALALAISVAATATTIMNQIDAKDRSTANRQLLTNINTTVENTNSLIAFTDRLDSPETKAENNRQIQLILDSYVERVDCNTRAALLDAIGEVSGPEAERLFRAKVESLCPPK